MKKPIETLDDFAKAIFEDKELFNSLCEFTGAMMKLSNARGRATDKILKKIYEPKGEQK